MKKRIFSIVLTVLMLITIVPAVALSAENKPTMYIAGDVYGAPGETVTVKVGFKNMGNKNIQQFEACLDASGASVVESTALQLTPATPGCYGYSNTTNGRFAVSGGSTSFSPDSIVNVQVTIPSGAKEGDTYPLTLTKFDLFPSVLQWADGTSPNGDVAFEGATLHVTRFTPVSISVQNTVASVGDSQIRVPIVMSKTNAKLASCTALQFEIGGSAAGKVTIDKYASKDFAIQGVNQKYTVMQPDVGGFALGFSGGYINSVMPSSDEFRIFELVLDVKTALESGDSLTVRLSADEAAFKVYGQSETDLVKLHVKEFVSGTVTVEMPYEWEVINENDATAKLLKYTGTATTVEVPSIIVGNGTVGTKGKMYKVVELYGSADDEVGVFCDNTAVTSITIPETVKTVNEYALYNCTGLTKLIVKSPDLTVAETYGETFLYYQAGRNSYKLLPGIVIESYQSATIRTWAEANGASFKNLVSFAGVQVGSNGIRFVGAMSDTEYQNVSLKITMKSSAETTYNQPVNSVFTTLNGTVGGQNRPVVTTDAQVAAEYTAAHHITDYRYLFGYIIKDVPATGTITFEITPTATTAYGVTVSGETVKVTYTNGQIAYA